jgi:hypothetical protein
MLNDDFLNFKADSKKVPKIPMRTICWLHYEKNKPLSIFHKTEFYDPFTEVTMRRKSGCPSSQPPIPKAYTKKFPIFAPKLKDMFTMCEKLMIPLEHHPNYDESEVDSTDVFLKF